MKFFILITCTLFFVACGGGSSSATTPPTPTENQPTSALQGSINDIEVVDID